MISDGIGRIPHMSLPSPAVPDFRIPTSFSIKHTNSYTVTDHFRRLKHGSVVTLPQMFLTFDSREGARSFHCDYTIRPANLLDPVCGKLHFVIKKDTANEVPEDTTRILAAPQH